MTLIEFVTAISVSTLLIVGIHASLFITLKGLPAADGPAATALQANRFLDRLATELESAIYVTELTATTVAFSLPDRNGDGLAERVRYAWSGIPGGALTRQYNGAAVETIAPQVDLFTLTPASRSVAENYPSLCVEDAAESLLIDYYSMSSTNNNDVTSSNWLAQHYTMTLPAGSYAWRPTRVDFAAREASVPGLSFVEMRPAASNLTPTNEVLTQDWLSQSSLTSSYTWQSYSFPQLDRIPSGGAICMVIERFFGTRSATLLSTNAHPGLQRSSDNGASWNYDNSRGIVSRLYGKRFRSTGTQSVNSTYLTSLDMAVPLSLRQHPHCVQLPLC